MEYLDFGINALSGPLPRELDLLTELILLGLSGNNFSSPLPSEIGNIRTLQQLVVHVIAAEDYSLWEFRCFVCSSDEVYHWSSCHGSFLHRAWAKRDPSTRCHSAANPYFLLVHSFPRDIF
ncbi:hypothetical protein SOVF_180740 [Spinacia oleracea]|nr:hypothetical protein SOVF_180740 [Spinacia oleracea]